MRLFDLLAERARQSPEAPYLLSADGANTFAQVHVGALRRAARLAKMGVTPNARVAVVAGRSPAVVEAIFAALGLGANVIPLDVDEPKDRITALHARIHPDLTLIEDEMDPRAFGPGCIPLADADSSGSATPDLAGGASDATAFTFFTTGSTAQPKGIELSHRAVISGQRWLQSAIPLGPRDRQLFRTTLGVSNLLRELIWPILAGCPTVLLPAGKQADPVAHADAIDRFGATIVAAVPLLIEAIIAQRRAAASLRTLRRIICTSDTFTVAQYRRLQDELPETSFYNIYGLTEAPYIAFHACDRGMPDGGMVPIGRAADLTPEVLNDQREPAAPGDTGRLFVHGDGLLTRYADDPTSTAARFLERAGVRLFDTGDFAWRSADGLLHLTGRSEYLLKVGGKRVEIADVESSLRSLAGVGATCVAPFSIGGGTSRLAAWVVAAQGVTLDEQGLRRSLSGLLPPHMVPSRIRFIDHLPLTYNGKIDRMALSALEATPVPGDDRDGDLRRLVESVLGTSRLDDSRSLVELGGDSISALLIGVRAGELGWTIDPAGLLTRPLREALTQARPLRRAIASDLEHSSTKHGTDSSPRPAKEAPGRPFPMTGMQEGMLYHSLVAPTSGIYCEQFVFRIEGALDVSRLRAAWQSVVDTNDILRVALRIKGVREPLHVPFDRVEAVFEFFDPGGSVSDDSALSTWLIRDRQRGFELERPELIRATISPLGKLQHRLVLTYHHLILDAWSLFLLMDALIEAYDIGAPPLPADASPFSAYVDHVRRPPTEASLRFWRDQLRGFRLATSAGDVDAATLKPASESAHGSIEQHREFRFALAHELTPRLIEFSVTSGITQSTLVRAAYALALASVTHHDDVLFGVTLTHRPVHLRGADRMIGLFINTVPVRVQLDRSATLLNLLTRMQHDMLQTRTHEHVALVDIQRQSEMGSSSDLFETLLIFENFYQQRAWRHARDFSVEQERYAGWTNYALAVEAMPPHDDQPLQFIVKYTTTRFTLERVQSIATAMTDALTLLLTTPERQVRACIPALTKTDRVPESAQRIAPRTAPASPASAGLERQVADIWCSVLGRDSVSSGATFFETGGHSLMLFQLLARLEERFDIELDFADLHQRPTVAAQARWIAQRAAATTGGSRVA